MIYDLRSGLVLTATAAWRQVLQLGPYVVGGVLLAVAISHLDVPSRLGRWLNRGDARTVVAAACLGGISPLCTYGTVPVLVELLRGGASPGPTLAFLVASSLLNPQLFVLMAGGLGLRLALAQAAGVLLLSLPVGALARRLKPETLLNVEIVSPSLRSSPACPPRTDRSAVSTWARELLDMAGAVGLTFVVAVILAALVQTLIPPEWTSSLLGAGHWHGILLAGVLGVPLYACGGGAVPIVAGLLDQGMSSSAALAFFLAGPATRLTALAALSTLLNRRALVVYVAYIVVGALLVGIAFNLALGN